MMWLSRSDSRATICESRSRASSAVLGLVRTSIAPVRDASGLRISCAMFADIRPSVASRSACRIRDSMARIAERSSQALMSPSRSPSPERRAEKVMRTGTVEPSGRRSAVSCRIDARGLPSMLASIEARGTAAPISAGQWLPIAWAAVTPTISVPADWKIRSLKACRSRRSFCRVSSSWLVAR